MELALFGTLPLRALIIRAAPGTANERGMRPKMSSSRPFSMIFIYVILFTVAISSSLRFLAVLQLDHFIMTLMGSLANFT